MSTSADCPPRLTGFPIRAATSRLARVMRGLRNPGAMLAAQPKGPPNDDVAALG